MTYPLVNNATSTLSAQFVHGTDASLTVTSGTNFSASGGLLRIQTTDGTHWANYIHTGKSTNTLTGLTQSGLSGYVESDASYTFPIGSTVTRVVMAEDFSSILHTDITGEVNGITEKASPVSADLVIIEDSAASYAKKKVQVGNLPGGVDSTAIHKATSGEIHAMTEKTTPVAADEVVIEDSAASYAKKRLQLTNLSSLFATASHTQAVSAGGTGLTSGTSGGIPYFSASSAMTSSAALVANAVVVGGGAGAAPSTISASTTTTHALFATAGAPAFRAIAVADLPTVTVAKGGTGLTAGTSGGVPYFSSTSAITSSALLAANAVMIGGGAGAAPATITAETTTTYALFATAGAPAFRAIAVADLPTVTVAKGGTGITSGTSGGIPYFSASSTIASSAALTANAVVVGGGAGATPSTISASTTTTHALFATAGAPAFRALAATDLPSFSGLTDIGTADTADVLIIEDASASYAKKKVLVSGLPAGGTDTNAIHKATSAEISTITEKVTPVSADLIIIEDSAASYAKKKVQVGNLPGGTGTDSAAIHDNVSAEISAITEKTSPVSDDVFIIEDSAASYAKKKVLLSKILSFQSSAGYFTDTFSSATSKTVTHNLGRYPAIVAIDGSGNVIDCHIAHGSVNAATLTFNEAATGTVFCAAGGNGDISDSVVSTDHTYSGRTAYVTAGETVVFGQLLYIDQTTGKYKLCDADQLSTMPAIAIALEDKSDTQTCKVLLWGYIRDNSWNWTADNTKKTLYASTTSGGFLDATTTFASGDYVQAVGQIIDADRIFFNPSSTLVVVA